MDKEYDPNVSPVQHAVDVLVYCINQLEKNREILPPEETLEQEVFLEGYCNCLKIIGEKIPRGMRARLKFQLDELTNGDSDRLPLFLSAEAREIIQDYHKMSFREFRQRKLKLSLREQKLVWWAVRFDREKKAGKDD